MFNVILICFWNNIEKGFSTNFLGHRKILIEYPVTELLLNHFFYVFIVTSIHDVFL